MAPQHVPRIVAVALLGCLALFFMIASLNTAARSTFAQGSAKVSLFDRYERHSLKTENEALKAQLQALTERMEQRNSASMSRAAAAAARLSDDPPPAGGGAVDTAPQLPTPSADSTAGRPKRGGGALSVVEVLPNAATTTVGTAAAGNPADPATHKYRLTKELVRARCDKYNIILVTFVNAKRADYAYTWASHVQRLNLTNYLVGAMDTTALGLLNGRGIPAFDMESGLTTADFGWGTKNFRQLGLRKTELIVALLRAGADPILTDADALITRDPTPFVAPLLPEADILVTSDHLMSTTTDDGLELPEHAAVSKWNIGYFYIRHTALKAIVHWQQMCAAKPTAHRRATRSLLRTTRTSPTRLSPTDLPRRARAGAPTTRRCGTRTCSRTSSRSAGCGSARATASPRRSSRSGSSSGTTARWRWGSCRSPPSARATPTSSRRCRRWRPRNAARTSARNSPRNSARNAAQFSDGLSVTSAGTRCCRSAS